MTAPTITPEIFKLLADQKKVLSPRGDKTLEEMFLELFDEILTQQTVNSQGLLGLGVTPETLQ